MSVELTNRSGMQAPIEDLASLFDFAIGELGLSSECELNVLLVDESEMTQMHIEWMGEEGPTDVLSFPMDELQPHSSEVGILGDIVLCPKVALAQAEGAGHSYEYELAILSTHGLLHLVGFDHAEVAEEAEMFGLQESLVKKWRP